MSAEQSRFVPPASAEHNAARPRAGASVPQAVGIEQDLALFERMSTQLGDSYHLLQARVAELKGEVYGQDVTLADFRHLPAARPFLVLVPQWDFLAFIAAQARRLLAMQGMAPPPQQPPPPEVMLPPSAEAPRRTRMPSPPPSGWTIAIRSGGAISTLVSM